MRQILLLVLAMLLIGTDFCHRDTEPTEIEIVIVKAPGQPRHPYQDEYERMLYPTVRISSSAGTGSGVVFTTKSTKDTKEEVYILTAAHVVEDQSTVEIEFFTTKNTKATKIEAEVVITDTVKDLALLKPQISTDFTDKIYTGKLADKDYIPYLFSPVWVVGCSLGLKPRPSFGHLSALCDSVANWEITAPVLPGNSGGPVYDARTYEVIGIAVWVKVCQGQLVTTMAGIVPIQTIYEFLEQDK